MDPSTINCLRTDEERLIYFYLEYDDLLPLSQTSFRHRKLFQELLHQSMIRPYSRKAIYKRHDGQEWTPPSEALNLLEEPRLTLYVKILKYDDQYVYYQTRDYGHCLQRTWPLRRSYHYFFSPNLLRLASPVQYQMEHADFQKTYDITQDAIPPFAYLVIVLRVFLLYIPLYTMMGFMMLIFFFSIPILLVGALSTVGAFFLFFYEAISVPHHRWMEDEIFF
jgi:hypothetical protein